MRIESEPCVPLFGTIARFLEARGFRYETREAPRQGASLEQDSFSNQVVRGPCGSREMPSTTCPVSLSLPWRATSA